MIVKLLCYFICLFDLFFQLFLVVVMCATGTLVVLFTDVGLVQSQSFLYDEAVVVWADHAFGIHLITGAPSALLSF